MNTPTIPNGRLPEREPARDGVYEGIHAKTGKRYKVRMTQIIGEVGGSRRLLEVLDSIVIESKDPTLP